MNQEQKKVAGLPLSTLILGSFLVIFMAISYYSRTRWTMFENKANKLKHVELLSKNGQFVVKNTSDEPFYITGFSSLYWVEEKEVGKKLKQYEFQAELPAEIDENILKKKSIYVGPYSKENLIQYASGQNNVEFPGKYIFFSLTILTINADSITMHNYTNSITEETKEFISINPKEEKED